MKPREAGSPVWLILLLFISGAAGIGYQVLWAKAFGAGVGHEYPATLAVITAFMCGIALGGFTFERYLHGRLSPRIAYGLLELTIAGWGAVTVVVIPWANRLVIHTLGEAPSVLRQWITVFAVVFICLAPATAAMGATLPALERFLFLTTRTRITGLLYGANTAGAMAGALGAAFVAMPRLGIRTATLCAAFVNLVCGLGALRLMGRGTDLPQAPNAKNDLAGPGLALRLAVTGLLGIGFEVVMIRGLAHVLESTVYTFAALLAVYLLGTALGAAAYQRWPARLRTEAFLLGGIAGACVLAGVILRWTPAWYAGLRGIFGDTLLGVAVTESIVAVMVFLPATFGMGATFSRLAEVSLAARPSLGWAVGVNSLGAAVAPALFGLLIIPALGLKLAIVAIALGYVSLMGRTGWPGIVLVLGSALLVTGTPELISHPGNKVVFFREGLLSSVAVLESTNGSRVLKVNNRFQMGGTASRIAEQRHADIPLLLHPEPRSALFIGLGTGITFETAAYYPSLKAEAVELLPEVVEAAPLFRQVSGSFTNRSLQVKVADGRRFVLITTNAFDVIVGDLFHPAQDGAGLLYSREHFSAVRERLAEGGLFCQWLPLFQMDLRTFDLIANTFSSVFPGAELWLLRFNVDTPAVALIGWRGNPVLTSDLVEKKSAQQESLREHLRTVALGDSVRLFGCRIGLLPAASAAQLNTEDRPVVVFEAPRLTFQRQDIPGERLMQLLARYQPADAAAALLPGNPSFQKRVEDFALARNLYLEGLLTEERGDLTRALDLYVETARRSADFTSGYAQALGIATTLARSNTRTAEQILERLAAVRPERPVANQLLERLRTTQPQ